MTYYPLSLFFKIVTILTPIICILTIILLSYTNFKFKKWTIWIAAIIFIGSTYAHYIEPQILLINEQEVDVDFISNNDQPIRIAVFADAHLGPFKPKEFLEKVINKTNSLNPDIVLLAGDFYQNPKLNDAEELLSPLNNLLAPTFAVSGNHDFGTNNNYYKSLTKALAKTKVNFIEDKITEITINNKLIKVVGISDLWFGTPKPEILKQTQKTENVIALIHNPDTIMKFPNDHADLTIAGHTHGGQIRIPFLYKLAIPTKYPFDKGLTKEHNTQLFITSGIGESGLPLRFLVPPEIAILKLK